jgi:hypothetical protein
MALGPSAQELTDDEDMVDRMHQANESQRMNPWVARIGGDYQQRKKRDRSVEYEVGDVVVERGPKDAAAPQRLRNVLHDVAELRKEDPPKEPPTSERSLAYYSDGSPIAQLPLHRPRGSHENGRVLPWVLYKSRGIYPVHSRASYHPDDSFADGRPRILGRDLKEGLVFVEAAGPAIHPGSQTLVVIASHTPDIAPSARQIAEKVYPVTRKSFEAARANARARQCVY